MLLAVEQLVGIQIDVEMNLVRILVPESNAELNAEASAESTAAHWNDYYALYN